MRNIINSNDAVVGIVVTVLLIGLAISVAVMIRTTYVPRWVEENEVAHMDEIKNQFAQLKYALDIQSIVKQKTAVSSSITLGTKEIPIFGGGRSFGTLQILEDQCNISVHDKTNNKWFFSLGMIEYNSGNSYFVSQNYIYQGGALILSQPPDEMLIGKPTFLIIDYTNIYFTIVNITHIEGKDFASGDGTYPIYTEFVSNTTIPTITNVTYINITTNYPNAWKIVFESVLRKSDNPFSADDVTISGNRVIVSFPTDRENKLSFDYVKILAQVSPGWIE